MAEKGIEIFGNFTYLPDWIDEKDCLLHGDYKYQAWLRILIRLSNKSNKVNNRLIKGVRYAEQPFEYAFTISFLTKAFGLESHQSGQVRDFLDFLEEELTYEGMPVISKFATNRFTVIKLLEPISYIFSNGDFEEFITNKTQTENNQNTNKPQTKDKQNTTIKKAKKNKSLKELEREEQNFSKKIIDDINAMIPNEQIKNLLFKDWIPRLKSKLGNGFALYQTINKHLNNLVHMNIQNDFEKTNFLIQTQIELTHFSIPRKYNFNEKTKLDKYPRGLGGAKKEFIPRKGKP